MKSKALLPAGIVLLVCLGFLAGRFTAHPSAATAAGRRVLYYVDPMHPAYRSDKPGIAPDCGMALEPVYAGDSPLAAAVPGQGFALTPERQRMIGLRVAPVVRNSGTHTIRTTGRIVPEDDRYFRIQAGFEGWVEALKDTPPGTLVKKDQVLATLYGPEIRTLGINYIGFISGVERVKQGMAPGDTRALDDSKHVNEEQLRLIGMGQKQIDELAASHRSGSSLDLVAPADAVVLARTISPYQRFEKGAELYRLADLTKVWIVADLQGLDGELRPGQTVRVDVPELNRTVPARVTSTLPLFDETSRTLKLRLEADNPGLWLRPDMFVDVELETKMPPGLSVPADAVLDSGRNKVVYVETNEGVFEPRLVKTASVYGDQVIVTAGLQEKERVVVSGNFLLDSESRMRTGSSMSDPPPPNDSAARKLNAANRSGAGFAADGETRDPVCGMPLKPAEIAFSEDYGGKTYHFCSDSCRRKFRADPAKYSGDKAALVATRDKAARP
jgi:multidrug efflux pump subunit AcrA (membrane-fusion protein)/YHS domain-containing protein